MTMRHVRTVRRAGAAALLSAALTFSLAACGGDGGGSESKEPASTAPQPTKGGDKGTTAPDSVASEPIATVKGDGGLELSVFAAKRDDGGFLTVDGEFKNTGSAGFSVPVSWYGLEQDVAATGHSFAGMTLVDSQGRKRYYVLRDTDNRPLTTYAYDGYIKPGQSLTFFAQFPAPPQTTTKVALQFPGFPSTSIELS
ncbi:hypothetical protein ACFYWY_28375 [Streptomyces sp. NPDC002870]|uniref:hypothetical protein n=1 Tax=Streptomyces sp. NPDC002870 TaxID=3364666 RepID=UPI003688AFFD